MDPDGTGRPGACSTPAQLRVAGSGPGAANVVGLIDQTDLFFTLRDGMASWSESRKPGRPRR